MKKVKPKDEYMKTSKDNINNIINDKQLLPKINNLVFRTNKIVIHSYQFLKLYLCHLYDGNKPFPIINKTFISHLFKIVTTRTSKKGKKSENLNILSELTDFYDLHYKSIQNDIIYYDNLTAILAYEAIDMVTNINNNIQEHFIKHLNKYINLMFKFKERKTTITNNTKDKVLRKRLHKELYDEFFKVKKDIIQFGTFTSDVKYHDWIKEQQNNLFSTKSFEKDSIHYQLKSDPQSFLKGMFHINSRLEDLNKNQDKQIRLFNVLPLRTNIVPKHICIDTVALIKNLLDSGSYHYLKTYSKQNQYKELWDKILNLKCKVFKKNNYEFHYMIKTDGISCSILFNKIGYSKFKKSVNIVQPKLCYIEDTILTDELRAMKIVCADPGMSDLIYCGSGDNNGNLETFRYTQNQRRLETGNKKYLKLRERLSKETMIDNKRVKEIETHLSLLNSETCNFKLFKEYCEEKNKINTLLFEYYEQFIFRKLKLNSFTNTQKSESKLIKNFQKKFGPPDKAIFIIGDYDKGNHHMKGVEPVICKKFRTIFQNAGYQTFLVNEFRTSKICNDCHGELEKFKMNRSKNPNKMGQKELCHGLLRCQSVTQCKVIHNRDKNAVQNMLDIVQSIFETGKRPDIFCRTSCTLHDGTNHILTF